MTPRIGIVQACRTIEELHWKVLENRNAQRVPRIFFPLFRGVPSYTKDFTVFCIDKGPQVMWPLVQNDDLEMPTLEMRICITNALERIGT